MKLPTAPLSLVALSTMLPLALANFDIYYTEFTSKYGSTDLKEQGYMLFNDDPTDCTSINTSPFIPWRNNFKGLKFAVTCDYMDQDQKGACMEPASLPVFLWGFFMCEYAKMK
jgi:hypothetical protein